MSLGHYGIPGLIVAAAGIAALVIHLAVPFASLDYGDFINDAGQEDETWSRSQTIDAIDQTSDPYAPSHPDVTLAGTILVVVAGLVLGLSAFAPLATSVARGIGWGAGLLATVGAAMAFTSSMYWVGSGFSTFMEVISGNDNLFLRLWAISPVIVAALTGAACWGAIKTMVDVVKTDDGRRDHAKTAARGALWASLLFTGVALLPWALHVEAPDDQGAFGPAFGEPTSENQLRWYGALTAFNFNEATDGDYFAHLSFSLKIMTATAWTGFLLSMLATAVPLAGSTDTRAALVAAQARWGMALMFVWGAVHYVLAWAYQWRPSWDEDVVPASQTWLPGFFPVLIIPVLAFWAMHLWPLLRDAVDGAGALQVDVEKADFD